MADSDLTPILLAQAWQITFLIIVVGGINRWLSRKRPHLAHALWLVVLVKCVTPPMWSSHSGVFCWLQPPREVAQQRSVVVEPTSRSWSELLNSSPNVDRSFAFDLSDHGVPESGDEAVEFLLGASEESLAELQPAGVNSVIGWPSVLFGLWFLVSLGVIGVAIVRCLRCWRIVRSAPQRECSELSEKLDSLAKQLRLRRRVRLIVTESRLGPAVIGLFRTTVLLPALIVDRLAHRSPVAPRQGFGTSLDSHHPEALEDHSRDGHPVAERQGYIPRQSDVGPLAPILAHELLHIRRGDLWVGLLQTLAQAVWWCHPLVWWVNRRTTREAERCCDEEVLAELGCDPAAYARALVDVLELKRELKPVPVFPGVRPVEVTSQRLERIMQLGQGCQRRTPWWCWLLAALAAAATWPGAAFVVTAEDPTAATQTDSGERGGVSPLVSSSPGQESSSTNRGADAASLANTTSGVIVRRIEPRQGLVYQVRVISGAEDDLRTLARACDEKLIVASSSPVVVTNDELQRLLKAAQAAPRINLVSHPAATGRGGESAIVADTKNFAVPVEVTQRDETVQFFDVIREHGWKLTLQPVTLGESSLRLRVVNWQGRLNHDDAVKVRYRTTGEEKLIPGLSERQSSTTVELRDDQHLVFPAAPVPESPSQTFMLLTLQVRRADLGDAIRWPAPTPSALPGPSNRRVVGVNSDAGVSGEIVLEERTVPPAAKFEIEPASDGRVTRDITSWSDLVSLKTNRGNHGKNEAAKTKLQLDSLGQLLWQHHSWFVVVRPESGQKLIDGGESPGKFHSDGPVRLMLTKMVDGVSNKHQIRIAADEFNLSSDEKGLGRWIRLSGHVRLAGQGFQVESDLMELGLEHKLTSTGHEKMLGARLRGHILLRKNTNGEETVLKADQAILSLRGTALAQFHSDETGPVGVLWDLAAEDKMLIPGKQVGLAQAAAEKRISVHFENAPLKRVLEHLAKESDRNIHLDPAGLEDESLTERTPVTLSLEDVKLSSALKLLLEPLNLGYRVEESDVIVVTSQQRLKGQPVVVTYSVADLVVPVPKRATMKLNADQSGASVGSKPSDPVKPMQLQLPELVELFTSTCQPNSWEAVGGNGRIKANDSTLSLVVWQTQDVHDEIRDLLEQLRRLQDLQAALHIETLTVPADFWHKVGKDFDDPNVAGQPIPQPQDKSAPRSIARLTKKEAALLRSLSKTESAPKVTLFNGQELEVFFGGETPTMRLALKPVVSADRTVLRLQAAATKPEAELDFAKMPTFLVQDGHSLLLDVTEVYSAGPTAGVPVLTKVPYTERLFKNSGKSDRRTLLLITGRVIVIEEESTIDPEGPTDSPTPSRIK